MDHKIRLDRDSAGWYAIITWYFGGFEVYAEDTRGEPMDTPEEAMRGAHDLIAQTMAIRGMAEAMDGGRMVSA